MRTGFDHESTTTDVLEGLDLAGRRFAITGTSAGLGEEATPRSQPPVDVS